MNSKISDTPKTAQFKADDFTPTEAVQRAIAHYQCKGAAKRFASNVVGTATDRREKNCVTKAWKLADVPAGATVLDIPCGAGRMLPLLKKCGYKITGADVSANMVKEARRYAGSEGENCLENNDELVVSNVFQTGFEHKRFDAVMCHRLFQYFNRPEERRMALNELRRISKGPVIVSFLCNWSLDTIGYKIRRFFGITRERSCKPISATTFAKDIRACGLEVERWIAMRPFISKRWYAVLSPVGVRGTLTDKIRAYRDILWAAFGRLTAVTAVILIVIFALNYASSTSESPIAQIVNKYQDGNNNFYVSANPNLQNLHLGEQLSVITNAPSVHSNIIKDQNQSRDSYFLVSYEDMKRIEDTDASPHLSLVETVKVGNEKFVLLSTENKQYVD